MADDNVDDGGNDYNEGNLSYVCAAWAPILGFAGIASAVVFASTFPSGDTVQSQAWFGWLVLRAMAGSDCFFFVLL